MGKLVIDGNSVYEIDEECVKRQRPPRECGLCGATGSGQETDRYPGYRERGRDGCPEHRKEQSADGIYDSQDDMRFRFPY